MYQESSTINESFVYDENGNRLRRDLGLVRTFSDVNGYYPDTEWLLTDGKYAFVYDRKGNQVEKGSHIYMDGEIYRVDEDAAFTYLQTLPAIEPGIEFVKDVELISGRDEKKLFGYWQYEWDVLNRLRRVYMNGDTEADAVAEYGYGPDGLRTWKRSGESLKHYVYEGNDLIFERDVTASESISYVYGMGRQLVQVDGVIGDESAERYYSVTDHLGSVRAVTDEDGVKVWEGEFDPFGNLLTEELLGESYVPEYWFAGKRLDDETGLYYFNARWYDATTGRFVSSDPIMDGLNWFVYCGNNPLVFVDPTGLYEVETPFWYYWKMMGRASGGGGSSAGIGLRINADPKNSVEKGVQIAVRILKGAVPFTTTADYFMQEEYGKAAISAVSDVTVALGVGLLSKGGKIAATVGKALTDVKGFAISTGFSVLTSEYLNSIDNPSAFSFETFGYLRDLSIMKIYDGLYDAVSSKDVIFGNDELTVPIENRDVTDTYQSTLDRLEFIACIVDGTIMNKNIHSPEAFENAFRNYYLAVNSTSGKEDDSTIEDKIRVIKYVVPRQLNLPNPDNSFCHYLPAQISCVWPKVFPAEFSARNACPS